ncbi:Cox20/FAM36A [Lasallia pustulata]|uniref:Cytochrome c oxidase assembly protein COX20, mitochondrial n=1 Tax=Lasallia pustulata TaxID=136370 RepID=A0A1W5D073_9LECA|nr:Cox20/FAM36A [Lasallia pustulata]
MAGDIRDNAPPPSVRPPKTPPESSNERPYQGKIYERFHVPATPENANVIPGGTTNTAGGRPEEAGLIEAVKTVRVQELTEVHKKPCVRDSFLTGMGASFGVGGLRAILGASVWTSCNWAVGTFCFGSFLMYEFCQRKRQLEMQGMKKAAEIIDRKKVEKEKIAEQARAARRKAKEEADTRAEEEAKRKSQGSWKFW